MEEVCQPTMWSKPELAYATRVWKEPSAFLHAPREVPRARKDLKLALREAKRRPLAEETPDV